MLSLRVPISAVRLWGHVEGTSRVRSIDIFDPTVAHPGPGTNDLDIVAGPPLPDRLVVERVELIRGGDGTVALHATLQSPPLHHGDTLTVTFEHDILIGDPT